MAESLAFLATVSPGLRTSVAMVLSALLAWGSARLLIGQASRWGLQDLPNERSSHQAPTPRGGGIGIVAAFLLAVPLALPGGRPVGAAAWLVIGGALLLTLVGLADDRRGLGLGVRLAAQAVAVAALCASAVVALPGGASSSTGGMALGPVEILLIGIAVVGSVWWINLFNFMDGIDGLAGSQALFMLLALVVIDGDPGRLHGGSVTNASALVLVGALAGFLLLNWSPARIFMGDSGSLFLGFSILAKSVHDVTQGHTTVWTCLIVGSLFLSDATITLARRAMSGQMITVAHRSHAYQRLARSWGSHARVALVYLLINCCWLFPLALLSRAFPTWGPLLLATGCLPLMTLCWRLGAGLKDR